MISCASVGPLGPLWGPKEAQGGDGGDDDCDAFVECIYVIMLEGSDEYIHHLGVSRIRERSEITWEQHVAGWVDVWVGGWGSVLEVVGTDDQSRKCFNSVYDSESLTFSNIENNEFVFE